jgi:hypothetical protein
MDQLLISGFEKRIHETMKIRSLQLEVGWSLCLIVVEDHDNATEISGFRNPLPFFWFQGSVP